MGVCKTERYPVANSRAFFKKHVLMLVTPISRRQL
ncbi:hypothetical protein BM1374166_02022 [Bartonella tribocorum]|nr:hypothetical protein BM1374166_02022 [Bartonella tribocorum]